MEVFEFFLSYALDFVVRYQASLTIIGLGLAIELLARYFKTKNKKIILISSDDSANENIKNTIMYKK